MAKKKLTARQRKARKRAAYIRAEYYKNFDALEYLRNFTKVKDIKIPNKITKKSLESIRRIYKETKANVATLDGYYVDVSTGEIMTKLPTKAEMVKEVRNERTQQYRQYRAEPEEAPPTFDPDAEYIEELKRKIQDLNTAREQIATLQPLRDSDKTEKNYTKNVVPKFESAQQRLIDAIDSAIAEYGISDVAWSLASNSFIQRIANLEEKYTHEIVESIDDDIIPLIEESVSVALEAG